MIRAYIVLAALFGLTGVALGAFASHALKSQLSAAYLAVFQTGVQYQMLHALALLGIEAVLGPVPAVDVGRV
ncbi:DUF423 domain-containing protein, partial [Klebsiella pneumoniae]|uniref:DUF423 domain-containing protein n=1 Tax=Klebsiella pneumoniae TaxID=573 RepID=UPI00210EAF8E